MYEQQIREDIFFLMLYAGVAMMFMMASCYLLFRRGNAFSPDITSSVRLRRWTAAFFAAMVLNHVWYLPVAYSTTRDDAMMRYLFGGLLDSMTVLPLSIIVLLTMLQDRRRPLWPVGLMVAPFVVGMAVCVFRGSDDLWPVLNVYLLLMGIGFTIYMVFAVRQYGRWLRDNYADLEHKEVWQSFVVLAAILMLFSIYVSGIGGTFSKYLIHVGDILLVCYLLWRVETLSDLSIHQSQASDCEEKATTAETEDGKVVLPAANDDITKLLQDHCVDAQLYLQHDLTLQQLAKAIGINRYYLSQYFSRQGTTYNAYINGLRVNHFVSLYHEAVATHSPITTKQLAHDSGYRCYSTFSLAFKQLLGQNVTAWMRDTTKSI